jgi:hypothetical protein
MYMRKSILKTDGTALDCAAWRDVKVVGTVGTRKRIEGSIARCALQPFPFRDGDDDGSFNATTGDDLWAFLKRGVEQLTEAGFGVGYGPGHEALQMVIYLVIE